MNRRGRLTILGVLCVIPVTGCAGRLPWRSDYERAMAEARFNHKPTLMMFSATMCPRCWHMDKEVFTDERLREELALYQLVRVDLPTHAKLAEEFGFTGTPSFVVFDVNGRALAKHSGTLDPQMFVRFLQRSRMNR